MENKVSLSKLVNESKELLQTIIDNDGVLGSDLEEMVRLNELQMADKVESYAFLIQSAKHEATYFKGKADFFYNVAKGLENFEESLKERIKYIASVNGITEFHGIDHKFKISNSKATVQIVDESQIDRAYFTPVVTEKLDKKRIEEDLRMGIPVPGAVLREGKAIRISANKKVGA